MTAGFQFGGCQSDFRPSGWGLLGIHARCLECVFVVVEDGGGAVERKAQHLAVGRRVIAGNSRYISFWVKFQASVLHDFADGNDGAFAGHHGGSAHFKNLQDVGCIAGPVSRNGCGHGLVVAALEGRHNFVIFLAGIKVFGLVIDPFTQGAAHGVPPLNFGLGLGAYAESSNGQCSKGFFIIHKFSYC